MSGSPPDIESSGLKKTFNIEKTLRKTSPTVVSSESKKTSNIERPFRKPSELE